MAMLKFISSRVVAQFMAAEIFLFKFKAKCNSFYLFGETNSFKSCKVISRNSFIQYVVKWSTITVRKSSRRALLKGMMIIMVTSYVSFPILRYVENANRTFLCCGRKWYYLRSETDALKIEMQSHIDTHNLLLWY